jgi:hypothetical protein
LSPSEIREQSLRQGRTRLSPRSSRVSSRATCCSLMRRNGGGPMSDMRDVLGPAELAFLPRLGLTPDDVMDVRHLPDSVWKRRIREEGKQLALGARCGKGGHRLRTRSGHCVQCDIRKFVFGKVFSAEQYVYIAGSKSARVIKFGTSIDWRDRERQMRARQYGDIGDWKVLYAVKVRNAGAVEHAARRRLARLSIAASYWQDGVRQGASELLKCSFSRALAVLEEVTEHKKIGFPWKSRLTMNYEFE